METQTRKHYKIKRMLFLCLTGIMLLVVFNNALAIQVTINNLCPKHITIVWGCGFDWRKNIGPGEQPIHISPAHPCYSALTLVGPDLLPWNTVFFYPFKEHDFSITCKKRELSACSCRR